jgi:spermidine/putrescine transport system permease protein
MVSAGLFAFLLSWGNFPLSLFTLGVDATLPKWLYARMVSGYTPLVPTVGMLSVAVSAALAALGLGGIWLRGRMRRRAAAAAAG